MEKYKSGLLIGIIFLIAFISLLIFVARSIHILFALFIFVLGVIALAIFLTVVYSINKKELIEKRSKKRNNALEKAGQYIKLYTNNAGYLTIQNKQLAVRFNIIKKQLEFIGILKSQNKEIRISTVSKVKYLVDDVWDYICFRFDRSTELSEIFYICITNCLNLSVVEPPKGITEESVIIELLNECKNNSKFEFKNDDKLDINIASEDELSKLGLLEDCHIKKILKFRTEKGPFTNYNEVVTALNISRAKLKEMLTKLYISAEIAERYKIEQSLYLA